MPTSSVSRVSSATDGTSSFIVIVVWCNFTVGDDRWMISGRAFTWHPAFFACSKRKSMGGGGTVGKAFPGEKG
jgi:hypothetical protein